MNLEQLVKLLHYIRENNGWGLNMYKNAVKRHRRVFKYIDVSFDTRDGSVWRVLLRGGGGESGKSFRIENEDDLKKLYKYLDEEVRHGS